MRREVRAYVLDIIEACDAEVAGRYVPTRA